MKIDKLSNENWTFEKTGKKGEFLLEMAVWDITCKINEIINWINMREEMEDEQIENQAKQ